MGLFNFRPSVRPVPMEVHIEGFAGRHYCPRMATMNKPCFQGQYIFLFTVCDGIETHESRLLWRDVPFTCGQFFVFLLNFVAQVINGVLSLHLENSIFSVVSHFLLCWQVSVLCYCFLSIAANSYVWCGFPMLRNNRRHWTFLANVGKPSSFTKFAAFRLCAGI